MGGMHERRRQRSTKGNGGEDGAACLPTGDSAAFGPGVPLTVPVGTRLYDRSWL
jgi:hypothetical protein